MRCLVTGGAGFIGSNLVRYLLQEETATHVTTLDLLTYAGHLENLEGVLGDARHRFIHGDVCDPEAVADAVHDVDVIFHLAAESHVDRSIVDGHTFAKTNVLGTQTLLAAAEECTGIRFVQISTDEVYGELPWIDPSEPDRGPRFTEDTPLAPRSPYAATKAAADHLVLAYHNTYGLDAVVTRGSNNYGPFQHPEKLIPLMIHRALRGEPLPVYGDGRNIRDWMHVEDHCRGLVAAAARGEAGRVYNFGGGAERTNLHVVGEILRATSAPSSLIEHVTDRLGHDLRYAVDFSRASEELGWRPEATFEEGLRETVRWYANHRGWIDAVTG